MKKILTGFAIGDALGMPFETKRYGCDILKNWDGISYHESKYFGLEPGETTDDTGMTLALAKSLIEMRGKYSAVITAKKYLEWYKNNPIGIGGTTKKAMQNLETGGDAYNSGIVVTSDTCGNGPAMRIAPLGIDSARCYQIAVGMGNSKERTLELSLLLLCSYCLVDSRITHLELKENISAVGSLFYASEIFKRLIDVKDLPKIRTLENCKSFTEKREIFNNFDNSKSEIEIMDFLSTYNGFGILDTVLSATKIAEYVGANYLKGLQMAIRLGGDTDTRAALVGALIVSEHGNDVLPSVLVDGLKNKEEINEIERQLWNLHV